MPFHDPLCPAGERVVTIPLGAFDAAATLSWPEHPSGLVLLARAVGQRAGTVELSIARELRRGGLATLHLDLLPRATTSSRQVSSTETLAARLLAATDWAMAQPELEDLAIGYLGSGDASSAALRAAGDADCRARAIVGLGGRPDLAGPALGDVRAPVLLVAAGRDEDALEAGRRAFRRLDCIKRFLVIEGARDLAQPEALEEAGDWAAGWLVEHVALAPRREEHRRFPTPDRGPAALF